MIEITVEVKTLTIEMIGSLSWFLMFLLASRPNSKHQLVLLLY